MRKIIAPACLMAITSLLPMTAFADPLDKGEAYTTRQSPPEWMDGIDFTWLLVDYGVFALIVVALGWVLTKRIKLFESFESVICWPFGKLMSLASRLPILLRELAQGIVGLCILLAVVAWVMFCQWLYHYGLGAVAMAGLALEAVLLVRVIRQGERPLLTSHH